MSFQNSHLSSVLDTLQIKHRLNVAVNWRTLATVGVSPKTKIDLRLENVPVWTLINLIADQSGEGVAVSLREGVVRFNGNRLIQ